MALENIKNISRKKVTESELLNLIINLPYKEEDISNEDVKPIKNFIKLCLSRKFEKNLKYSVKEYLLKLTDNAPFEMVFVDNIVPKTVKIINTKRNKKLLYKELTFNWEEIKNHDTFLWCKLIDSLRKLRKININSVGKNPLQKLF